VKHQAASDDYSRQYAFALHHRLLLAQLIISFCAVRRWWVGPPRIPPSHCLSRSFQDGAPCQSHVSTVKGAAGDDRFGSKPASEECPQRVRFTSTNRHRSSRRPRRVSARTGLMQRSTQPPYGLWVAVNQCDSIGGEGASSSRCSTARS
jgi:hypothetical protein